MRPESTSAPTTPPRGVRAWEVRAPENRFAVLSLPLASVETAAALTPAELDIVRLVLQGQSNKDIALSRGTSVRTVANQLAALYQKLGLTSRAELVAHVCLVRPQ